MNEADAKIQKVFPDVSVYKIPQRYSIFHGKNLPSFIKDWLIRKFTDQQGELDAQGLSLFMENHIPHKNSDIKNRIRTHREEVTILARFVVETDIQKDVLRFSVPDLGIKNTEGRIPDYVAKKHSGLKEGEQWGIISLMYTPPEGREKGAVELTDYKPFKPYDADLEYFREARKEFRIEEWTDLLIRSMEYNPEGFKSLTQKLLFVSRLLIFVQPNLNLIELAPKGTGKSYIFGNLSKYGWLISGGIVSRAKLFYDISRNSMGTITHYDFVTMDEVETIKFSDENEMQGALKTYLENGSFTVAKTRATASAGLMLLGNIPLSHEKQPLKTQYFSGLPPFFQSSALLERFHGFIEGWKLERMKESLKVCGYTLNVEYFSEILHLLREAPDSSHIVGELLDIPKNADTRDTTAIRRLTTAYLKLLFPHVKSADEISKEEFHEFCLKPAMEKRGIIRRQLAMMDSEYSEDLPFITVKQTNCKETL